MCNSLAVHSQKEKKKYVDIVIIHSHTSEQTNKQTNAANIPIRFKEGQMTSTLLTRQQFVPIRILNFGISTNRAVSHMNISVETPNRTFNYC